MNKENDKKIIFNNDICWVLIYISAFGISDIFIKKYINNDFYKIIYYLLLGFIGLYIIYN
jgi:hypothetical protein